MTNKDLKPVQCYEETEAEFPGYGDSSLALWFEVAWSWVLQKLGIMDGPNKGGK